MTLDPHAPEQLAQATEELAATTRRLQAQGYPLDVILSAAVGLATCELIAIKGPAEAAERLREAARICQAAADRGEVAGPLEGQRWRGARSSSGRSECRPFGGQSHSCGGLDVPFRAATSSTARGSHVMHLEAYPPVT